MDHTLEPDDCKESSAESRKEFDNEGGVLSIVSFLRQEADETEDDKAKNHLLPLIQNNRKTIPRHLKIRVIHIFLSLINFDRFLNKGHLSEGLLGRFIFALAAVGILSNDFP